MKKVVLGNTNETVSAFCLGAMHFGTKVPKETAFTLLDLYCDKGGMFIDTANCYTHWDENGRGGESEELLGEWFASRGNRKDIFIATKVGSPYTGVEAGLQKERIISECEKSLKRLGIETIDLYYAHRDTRHVPLEETLEAFDSLVKSGKVKHIAVSNYMPWRIQKALDISESKKLAAYSCVQFRYSYLRQNESGSHSVHLYVDRNMIDFLQQTRMPLIAFSPLLRGAFTNSEKKIPEVFIGPDSDLRMETLRKCAQEVGATPNQVLLAWLAKRPFQTIPLFSASTEAQLKENLGAADLELSDEILERLNTAGTQYTKFK